MGFVSWWNGDGWNPSEPASELDQELSELSSVDDLDLLDTGESFESNSSIAEFSDGPDNYHEGNFGRAGQAYVIRYDGETSPGEMGPVVDYFLDHNALRSRSWASFLTNNIAKTVLRAYFRWIIDKGLKLQCAPSKKVLESEGITVDTKEFNAVTEARFSIWQKSKHSSFNGMKSLKQLSKAAFKNCKIAGDVLVILRLVEDVVKVELIDAELIQTPYAYVATDGNRIVNGVEIDKTGRHVAYHIQVKGKFERIEAWSGGTGMRIAWLVYGSEFRMNTVRGVSSIATSLNSLKMLERYKEAAVGSAEERQKIPFIITHTKDSTEENPMADKLAKLSGKAKTDNGQVIVPLDVQRNQLANKIAVTMRKDVYNMPKDSDMKALESKNEMFFKEFYSTNADIICACIGIPPNVAFSLYNDSFSASRAATKDWEHTMDVERDDFQDQFYDPIYAFWLWNEIRMGKIQAPGFMVSFGSGNFMVTEAYLNAKFTGSMFPHIDPLKEVRAERLKLGPLADHLPLTNMERATSSLFGGEYSANIEQFSQEIEDGRDQNLNRVVQPSALPSTEAEEVDEDD